MLFKEPHMLNGNGHQYHVFKTAAGYVAIGWKADTVTSLRLPASTEIEAARALRRRLPGATAAVPLGKIADVVEGVLCARHRGLSHDPAIFTR
jgi:hypothetical protein